MITFLIVYFIVCCIIAAKFGKKHRLGEGWTFFFCLFYTPIIGNALNSYSPTFDKINAENSCGNKWNRILSFILFSLSGLAVYNIIRVYNKNYVFLESEKQKDLAYASFIFLGLFGAAIYLFNRNTRHLRIFNKTYRDIPNNDDSK